MSGRSTLLFVDDDPEELELLTKSFGQDFDALTASKGEEALAILRTQHIDLLVTDQKMPQMTGIQLVEAARAEGIEVAAIVLSGFSEPQDLIAAINAGRVQRYVMKPWNADELRLAIHSALEAAQLRREKEDLLRRLRKRVEALSMIYDVSRQSASAPATYDAILDRVLMAVARVLPCDCAAALIALDPDRPASLRVQCHREVGDQGLLWVKDYVLTTHSRYSKLPLPEDRVMIRVQGVAPADGGSPPSFPSQLTVFLMVGDKPVGTLSLLSRDHNAYSAEDGELLDMLANQTIDAIQALRSAELEARRRMERMVESLADGLVLINEQNEIVLLNSAARHILHLPVDLGVNLRELEGILEFRFSDLSRRWEAGSSQIFREELQLFDRTIHATLAPVINPRGKLEGAAIALRDISEQKQLEERKDEFISIISHELRTPLTSISGALDLVLNVLQGAVNEKQRRYLALAKDSTDKLNAVVDELLDLSKFAKGLLQMSFEQTTLDGLIQGALEKYSAALLEKQIRWVLPQATSSLPMVADPGRVGQVLNNLLANALKYTPSPGEIQIHFGVDEQIPGYAWLTFWNSGDSIPEVDLERIFEKFEQAGLARKRGRRGTGLGLAICRSIAEAHGGKIWAEPCPTGAQFVLVLPQEPPAQFLPPETQAEESKAVHFARGSVLIFESNAPIALMLKAMLLQDHWHVAIAASAEQAMTLIRQRPPDVLVLNVEESALRLAEQVRADGQLGRVRILGLANRGDSRGHFMLEPDAALELPLQEQALRSAVEALQSGMALETHGMGGAKSLHSKAFERALNRRLTAGRPFAVCYFQLDRLSAYRLRHGLAKAADLLRQTEDLLREVIQSFGSPDDYLDRSANEDFVFITSEQAVDAVCQRAIAAFDRIMPLYYDRSEQSDTNGSEESGRSNIYACVTAVVCVGGFLNQTALARQVAELKVHARARKGSAYLRSDRDLRSLPMMPGSP